MVCDVHYPGFPFLFFNTFLFPNSAREVTSSALELGTHPQPEEVLYQDLVETGQFRVCREIGPSAFDFNCLISKQLFNPLISMSLTFLTKGPFWHIQRGQICFGNPYPWGDCLKHSCVRALCVMWPLDMLSDRVTWEIVDVRTRWTLTTPSLKCNYSPEVFMLVIRTDKPISEFY